MPHYPKRNIITFGITNQDAVLYPAGHGVNLKLPGIKECFYLSNIEADFVLYMILQLPLYLGFGIRVGDK